MPGGHLPESDADLFRLLAANTRRVIEQEERPFGRSSSPRWPETKAALLDLAAQWESMAADAEAMARSQDSCG
jgi:hypothetical protein